MKRISQFLFIGPALLVLAGCEAATGVPIGLIADEATGIYLTKPSEPPPADTANSIAPHESWCYSTMGMNVECYPQPQDTPPGRLVNVDPPNRYPLTPKAYAEDLTQSQLAAIPKPIAKSVGDQGAAPLPVQSVAMTPLPLTAAPKAKPAPKAASPGKTKKHKKKHKKPGKITKSPPAPVANPPGVPPLIPAAPPAANPAPPIEP
jgi:hypothetical protein